jgi:hypothetical protein
MSKRILIILIALLVCTLAEARKVSGRVHCSGDALSGVIVTDGTNFTTTRRNGKFKLQLAEDAKFVWVVTPSGYTADFSSGAPRFYRSAGDGNSFDFNLIRTLDTMDYTLFSVSDPQFKNEQQFAQFCAEPLEDLIENARKYGAVSNTVGIALGDVCWDNLALLEPYKQAIAGTGIPFYAVIGNHDHNQNKSGDDATREDFEDAFGPVNFAFFLGKDLVIGLDNIIYEGNKKYQEGYTDREFAFLKGLLAYIPAETHLYIAQHSPLYFWKQEKYVVRGSELLELLDGYRVDFLSGHHHTQNNLTYSENIREHTAPSICGTWWDTEYCPDGTPRGYQIFSSTDGDFRWFTHPIDYPDDFQYEIIPLGASRWNPDAVVANVWDYDEDWTVEWYQDGVPKGPMEQVMDASPTFIKQIEAAFGDREIPEYKQPSLNNHYFAARPDSTAKGIEIVIKGRNGEVWKEKVDLSE